MFDSRDSSQISSLELWILVLHFIPAGQLVPFERRRVAPFEPAS